MRNNTLDAKRKRLQLAREHAGYKSARQAALAMGWMYPTYASHENGTRDFPQRVAERYARAFNVSPEFLMFGRNPPEWAKDFAGVELLEVKAPLRSFRMFEDTDAGILKEWLENPIPGGPQFQITEPGPLSAKTIAISVTSEEMRANPATIGGREIKPGDIVLVDLEQQKIRPGDIVAVLVDGDDAIHLRKAVMRDGGKMAYVALNQDYGEFTKARLVGRVMWVMSSV